MARLFDDANSQRLVGASAAVTAVPLTIAAWVYLDDRAPSQAIAGVFDAAGDSDYHYLMMFGAPYYSIDAMSRAAAGSVADAYTSTSLSADTWAHACGVWAAANSRAAYLNGAGKGTNTTNVAPSGLARTIIGARNVVFYASGRIAEVAFWDAALTDAEVAILAKGVSPWAVRPGSLVFYAPLIRGHEDRVGGIALTESASAPTVADHPRIWYPAPMFFGE